MKKVMIFIFLLGMVLVNTSTYANTVPFENTNLIDVKHDINHELNYEINPELIKMLKSGEMESLTITYDGEFKCTLEGKISYRGFSVSFSITEEDCTKAGAGMAQAAIAFKREIDKLMKE